MADRSVAVTDTLETLRTTYNSTAGDVGSIASLTSASGTIASSTDIVEAVVAMNTEIAAITAGTSIFGTKIMLDGNNFVYRIISEEDFTLDIARYLICLLDLIIGTNSFIVYWLFGGLTRLIGKSRKILCCLCFSRILFNSCILSIHAKFIRKTTFSGIGIS